jgi:hypothetical protein
MENRKHPLASPKNDAERLIFGMDPNGTERASHGQATEKQTKSHNDKNT